MQTAAHYFNEETNSNVEKFSLGGAQMSLIALNFKMKILLLIISVFEAGHFFV